MSIPWDLVVFEGADMPVDGVKVTVRAELPTSPENVARLARLIDRVSAAIPDPADELDEAEEAEVAEVAEDIAPAGPQPDAIAARAPADAPGRSFMALPSGNRYGAPKRDALLAALRHAPRRFGPDDVVDALRADGYADADTVQARKAILNVLDGLAKKTGRVELVKGGPGVTPEYRLVGPKPAAPAAPSTASAADVPRAKPKRGRPAAKTEVPSPAPGRPSPDEVRRKLLERRGARSRNGSAELDHALVDDPDDDDLDAAGVGSEAFDEEAEA